MPSGIPLQFLTFLWNNAANVVLFVAQLTEDKRKYFIDWYKQLCRIGDTVENNKSREGDIGPKPVSLSPS